MTLFEMKRDEAKAKAQELMKPYGLEINKTFSAWYYLDSNSEDGVIAVRTLWQPVKGNKTIIEKLKADGYHVDTVTVKDYHTGAKHLEFSVRVEILHIADKV